jgi:putative addiction module CopG family antidote
MTATTMNVSLTPELRSSIDRRVRSGHYGNASDVIRAGLRGLHREEMAEVWWEWQEAKAKLPREPLTPRSNGVLNHASVPSAGIKAERQLIDSRRFRLWYHHFWGRLVGESASLSRLAILSFDELDPEERHAREAVIRRTRKWFSCYWLSIRGRSFKLDRDEGCWESEPSAATGHAGRGAAPRGEASSPGECTQSVPQATGFRLQSQVTRGLRALAARAGQSASLVTAMPGTLPLVRVCQLLNEAGAHYLVCGAQACILHGLVRTTEDVDILIEATEENCRRVIDGLARMEDGAARELTPIDLLENVVVKVADEAEVDISTKAWKVTYAEAIATARHVTVQGIEVPFLGLDALIASKETYREQDAYDRMRLLALKDRG